MQPGTFSQRQFLPLPCYKLPANYTINEQLLLLSDNYWWTICITNLIFIIPNALLSLDTTIALFHTTYRWINIFWCQVFFPDFLLTQCRRKVMIIVMATPWQFQVQSAQNDRFCQRVVERASFASNILYSTGRHLKIVQIRKRESILSLLHSVFIVAYIVLISNSSATTWAGLKVREVWQNSPIYQETSY